MKLMKKALIGITAAAVLTVGGGTALAATYWEAEPNTVSGMNDAQTIAEAVFVNDDIFGYIANPNDRDFYRFVAPASGASRIVLDKIPVGSDYILRVWNPVTSTWLSAPQPGNNPEFVSLNLVAGQVYYMFVSSQNGSFNPSAPYHLRAYL